MPIHTGFTATILVDGSPIEEYGTAVSHNDTTNTCKSYIVAQQGKSYSIGVKVAENACEINRTPEHLTLQLYVDGEKQDAYRATPGTDFTIDGYTCRKAKFPFKFNTPARDFDESSRLSSEDREKLDQLGSIRLEIWRTQVLGVARTEVHRPPPNIAKKEVGNTKKGVFVSHVTEYGAPIPAGNHTRDRLHYYGTAPAATIVFYYKSRELLEADGIIEIPDTDLILIDDSTDEYSDANAMRQTTPPPSPRTIKQELSIKRERSCSLSSSNKRVRYDSEGYSEIMRALRKMEQEIAQVKRQNSALAQENRRLKRQNGSVDEPIVLDD